MCMVRYRACFVWISLESESESPFNMPLIFIYFRNTKVVHRMIRNQSEIISKGVDIFCIVVSAKDRVKDILVGQGV